MKIFYINDPYHLLMNIPENSLVKVPVLSTVYEGCVVRDNTLGGQLTRETITALEMRNIKNGLKKSELFIQEDFLDKLRFLVNRKKPIQVEFF